MVDSRPMRFARDHRSLVAWMLLAFILFNGLACSICHGQMLGAFSRAPTRMECGMSHTPSHAMKDMSKISDMSPTSMKAMEDTCSFAASVAQALIFFIALGWLIRRARPIRAQPRGPLKPPPRYVIPRLQPQAP